MALGQSADHKRDRKVVSWKSVGMAPRTQILGAVNSGDGYKMGMKLLSKGGELLRGVKEWGLEIVEDGY